MENNNMLHHPIKFSIKTNDLEKLKRKPDKLFSKLDLKENDFDSISPITINKILHRKGVEGNLLTSDSKKSLKRMHEKEFEGVSSKNMKADGNHQVIIEPETSSTLVIHGLIQSLMPPIVTKEQSILQIFSKSNKVLTDKIIEKESETEHIFCNKTESLLLSDNISSNRNNIKIENSNDNDKSINQGKNYFKIINEKKSDKIDKSKNAFENMHNKFNLNEKDENRPKYKETFNYESCKEIFKYKETKSKLVIPQDIKKRSSKDESRSKTKKDEKNVENSKKGFKFESGVNKSSLTSIPHIKERSSEEKSWSKTKIQKINIEHPKEEIKYEGEENKSLQTSLPRKYYSKERTYKEENRFKTKKEKANFEIAKEGIKYENKETKSSLTNIPQVDYNKERSYKEENQSKTKKEKTNVEISKEVIKYEGEENKSLLTSIPQENYNKKRSSKDKNWSETKKEKTNVEHSKEGSKYEIRENKSSLTNVSQDDYNKERSLSFGKTIKNKVGEEINEIDPIKKHIIASENLRSLSLAKDKKVEIILKNDFPINKSTFINEKDRLTSKNKERSKYGEGLKSRNDIKICNDFIIDKKKMSTNEKHSSSKHDNKKIDSKKREELDHSKIKKDFKNHCSTNDRKNYKENKIRIKEKHSNDITSISVENKEKVKSTDNDYSPRLGTQLYKESDRHRDEQCSSQAKRPDTSKKKPLTLSVDSFDLKADGGCGLLNPEDHLEESFNLKTKIKSLKGKEIIRENLQKFLNKKVFTEEFKVDDLKSVSDKKELNSKSIVQINKPESTWRLGYDPLVIPSKEFADIPNVSLTPSHNDLSLINLPIDVSGNKDIILKELPSKSNNQEDVVKINKLRNESKLETCKKHNIDLELSKSNIQKPPLMIPLPEVTKFKIHSFVTKDSSKKTCNSALSDNNINILSQKSLTSPTAHVKRSENQSTEKYAKNIPSENFPLKDSNHEITKHRNPQIVSITSDNVVVLDMNSYDVTTKCDKVLPQIILNSDSSDTHSINLNIPFNLKQCDQEVSSKLKGKSVIVEPLKPCNISFKIKANKKPSLNVFDNIENVKESQLSEGKLAECISEGELLSSIAQVKVSDNYLIENNSLKCQQSVSNPLNVNDTKLSKGYLESFDVKLFINNITKEELNILKNDENLKKEESKIKLNFDNYVSKKSGHKDSKDSLDVDCLASIMSKVVEDESKIEDNSIIKYNNSLKLIKPVEEKESQKLELKKSLKCEQTLNEVTSNESIQSSKCVLENSKNILNDSVNKRNNIHNENSVDSALLNEPLKESMNPSHFLKEGENSVSKNVVKETLRNILVKHTDPKISECISKDLISSDICMNASKESLLVHNETIEGSKMTKVTECYKNSQTYKSRAKHLRDHSNRSKSKDKMKEYKKKEMHEVKPTGENKSLELQSNVKYYTKLNKSKEYSKGKKKSNELYKSYENYIHHNKDYKLECSTKDINKMHYRSRSKHRNKDRASKWNYRSSSSRGSDVRKKKCTYSRNEKEKKNYRSRSKYSRNSRSLSSHRYRYTTKDKLYKNVSYHKINKYNSSGSESRGMCNNSRDIRRSKKNDYYSNFVNKQSRHYISSKSRSNSRKKVDNKLQSDKKSESKHRWMSTSSDDTKCDLNLTKPCIQNKSKSLSNFKDVPTEDVVVSELGTSENGIEFVDTHAKNKNADTTHISLDNPSLKFDDISMKQLLNVVEINTKENDFTKPLEENENKVETTESILFREKQTSDSAEDILENRHNFEHDLKVNELAEQYINSILSLFTQNQNFSMTAVDLNCQTNNESFCNNQSNILTYTNQTLNGNALNETQSNIPSSLSFPLYNAHIPFNNYSIPNAYQPTYTNIYNPLQYYDLNSLQSQSLHSGAYNNENLNINSYYQPYSESQPVSFNNNEHLSLSSQWNLYNGEDNSVSQLPHSSQKLIDYNSYYVPYNDVRHSTTTSCKNSVVDMNIGSVSMGSIDSINDLKLDDIISDKDDLSSCGGFDFDDVEPQDPFQKFPDAPRPKYEHIVKNEVHASAVGKRFDYAYLKSTSCNCIPPNPDEIRMGKAACDENCFNRKIKVECNRRCPVYDLCTNRRFQEQIYGPIEPFFSGQDKGWGVRALSNISAGTFVIEYVGELIDFNEFLSRISQESIYSNHFLMVIQKGLYLDAGNKGNWARFVNHSCDPNAMIERWVVGGKTRIGFFSKKNILKDEEITIDYQFQQYGSIEQKCYCGSMNCTGIMGKVNEKLQEQIKCSELRYRKELIQRIISRKSLKEINHVSEMITVIKENCLDRDTFFSFLEVLLRSNSSHCIRTFIECGGLNVITSYLDTISWHDWSLKLLYLQCLNHFKLKKRILINSGYTSATVVEYWSQNPRYILKHLVDDSLDIDSFDDDSYTINDLSEPTTMGNESSIQFSLPNVDDPILEIEKQVQSLALKIKEYFNEEKAKFFIPKIKNNQTEFSNEFSTNDSESKSISIASSIQGDFIQMKTKKLQNKCTEAIQKLSKDEFRRLFSERYYKSMIERSQPSISNDGLNRNNEIFQRIKQLLSNVIIEEINNLKQNEQFYSMPQEFQNLDIDKILSSLNIGEYDDILPLLNPLLDDQSKSYSLSNYSKSSNDISKYEDNTSTKQNLPPNWRYCRCENGRIYFYHIITKKTQWESPVYPWDAGEDDPYSYNFGNAQNYQITADDIKLMHQIRKNKYKEDKVIEREKKRLERKLNLSNGDRNKIQFSREVFKVVKVLMKPYFSSSCKVGRVRSKGDLKFLCEKFAETIIGKEVKLVADLEDLELNSDVSSRITSYVKKYMANHGRNFKRSKKSKFKTDESQPPNTATSIDSDSPNLSL